MRKMRNEVEVKKVQVKSKQREVFCLLVRAGAARISGLLGSGMDRSGLKQEKPGN